MKTPIIHKNIKYYFDLYNKKIITCPKFQKLIKEAISYKSFLSKVYQ